MGVKEVLVLTIFTSGSTTYNACHC